MASIGYGLLHITSRVAAQSSVVVPQGAPVTIDGTWEYAEWSDRTLGDPTLTLSVHEAAGYVQIGLRAAPLLVASLCLARGDTVDILRASSA